MASAYGPRAKPELKARIGVVWLADNPHLIGVIAAPTPGGSVPRRLRLLSQQTGADGGRRSVAEWGATAEDVERGHSRAQRTTAETFAAAQAPDAQPPLVKQNPCGCFRIEVLAPSTIHALFGHSDLNTVMDASGTELKLTQYHPDDFLT